MRLEDRITLHPGDCLEILKTLDADSIDSCATDPPYHLTSIVKRFGKNGSAPAQQGTDGRFARASAGFMGQTWDGGDIAFRAELWTEVMRVLKPGAHLVAFGGTRTYHRMACAIEDAGFEIRDCILWLYGSGFPKSHDVSKNLDAEERRHWVNVCNSVDSLDKSPIVEAWIEYSKNVTGAGVQFARSQTATGTNMQKRGSVHEYVLLKINQERLNASAIIAELKSLEARLIHAAHWRSVLLSADDYSTASSDRVSIVAPLAGSQEASSSTISSALKNADGWPSGNMASKLKGDKALKTWLGGKPSSRQETIVALCAALTDDLKHITLNQSETFRSLDTKSQTDFVSATTVIITESTAECLITFMADTLKSEGIQRVAAAQREVIGTKPTVHRGVSADHEYGFAATGDIDITAAATDEARQWDGWGTALKPACEPCVLARKPLSEPTVAKNVLRWGTGALNIDACRVEMSDEDADHIANMGGYGNAGYKCKPGVSLSGSVDGSLNKGFKDSAPHPEGRWPANVIHDGSEEVCGLFPEVSPAGFARPEPYSGSEYGGDGVVGFRNMGVGRSGFRYGDSGGAARFFYTAKADKDDRLGSKHPTVKPLDLMQYLVRLITPPKGLVLDPFAGTGTTGEAAFREGMLAVLIEREAQYQEDIRRRMRLVLAGPDERVREAIKARGLLNADAGPLFGGFE